MWPILSTVVCLVGALPTARPVAAVDALVVFEVRGLNKEAPEDVDLYMQRVSSDGALKLGSDDLAIPLSNSANIERNAAVMADGSGGYYVAYEYEFTSGETKGDVDVVVQRFGANGSKLWDKPAPIFDADAPERRPILVPDGRGGAIVVVEVEGKDGDFDVYAHRVSPSGEVEWRGERAGILANSGQPEKNATAIPDGKGGVIAVFEWVDDSGDVDIMAQRLNDQGAPLWGESQALDVAASNNIEERAALVSDGSGGVIIAYELLFNTGENRGDRDILAQRLSPDGKVVWGGEGKRIFIGETAEMERHVSLLGRPEGGFYAAWELVGTSEALKGDVDILIQAFDGDGKALWNEGQKPSMAASSDDVECSPVLVSDAAGGAILLFEYEFRKGENAGDRDVVGVHVGRDGKSGAWGEGVVPASSSEWRETIQQVMSDGAGGVLVVCELQSPANREKKDNDVVIQRISATGKRLWREGKTSVPVADTEYLESRPRAAGL